MRKSPLKQEWEKIIHREAMFLKKAREQNPTMLNKLLEEKVPPKVQSSLEEAFTKSFLLIFEKGTPYIERSFSKENLQFEHDMMAYALKTRPDKKRFKAFDKKTTGKESLQVALSSVKGMGLGLLGIGLPDIPIFIGTLIRGVYEIALQHGYEYESVEGQYFVLEVIKTAFQHGDEVLASDAALNAFIKEPKLPANYNQEAQIEVVSKSLAAELLCVKFLQGMAVVGVVGGLADAQFLKRALQYAGLKYRRRFFWDELRPSHVKEKAAKQQSAVEKLTQPEETKPPLRPIPLSKNEAPMPISIPRMVEPTLSADSAEQAADLAAHTEAELAELGLAEDATLFEDKEQD